MPAFTIAASLILGQMVSTTPAHRMGEQWWKERHERCVEATKKGDLDVIFIGDSITQGWEGGGKAAWDKYFGEYKTGNFGFSGDRTEHVLWRMDNGEIVGLQPKVAVMMIGTNNIGHGSSNPEQTAAGVKAIVAKLRAKLPKTKILLLGIFPRGATSEDRMRLDGRRDRGIQGRRRRQDGALPGRGSVLYEPRWRALEEPDARPAPPDA